jgi:orotate phosphoribosyltransferase
MKKPTFADIFSGEFLGYISQYRKHIQEILDKYDVVIFMARKAVCFYRAMVLNGELVVPLSCAILSSRITDYNVLEKYKGKRIAVVDDVVVKGESLKNVVAKLNEHDIRRQHVNYQKRWSDGQ